MHVNMKQDQCLRIMTMSNLLSTNVVTAYTPTEYTLYHVYANRMKAKKNYDFNFSCNFLVRYTMKILEREFSCMH